MVGNFLVPRAQTRTCNESIKELSLVLPIGREFRLGHSQIVGIWRQTVLGLVRLNLLLGATQEEGTARVLDVKYDPFLLQVIEGVQKVALRRPAVRSAEIGHNMHIDAAAIASVV